MENNEKSRKKKKLGNLAGFLAFVLVIAIIILLIYNRLTANEADKDSSVTDRTAAVTKTDIQKVLTADGTIEPIHIYNVTSSVGGEVVADNLEEGAWVKEGDVLYQVTTEDIDQNIDDVKTSLKRAKEDYTRAQDNYKETVERYNVKVDDYNDAAEDYGDLTIKSTAAGIVKSMDLEEGDKIQVGEVIATVYDNTYMLLEIPFNSSDVSASLVGKKAKVLITESDETVEGTVTKVSGTEEVLNGGQVVKMVEIKVKNPGGITTGTDATASIGDLYSGSSGNFSALEDTKIVADKAGEIATLNIAEEDRVQDGETVIVLASDTYKDELEAYQNAVNSAKDAVDAAEDAVIAKREAIEDLNEKLDTVIDDKTDYKIIAPVTGKVVSKTVISGDSITGNNTAVLCTIYDVSSLKFDMYVDELDVVNVKVGQTVNVTADSFEGVTFTGKVTNVGIKGVADGVTQYPVTVELEDAGQLIPDMNVTGKIIVEEKADVLAVPNGALIHGNTVYVADAGVKEAVGGVPAGFKKVNVETGISDGSYTEIISGLSEGDIVYLERVAPSSFITQNTAETSDMGENNNSSDNADQ